MEQHISSNTHDDEYINKHIEQHIIIESNTYGATHMEQHISSNTHDDEYINILSNTY